MIPENEQGVVVEFSRVCESRGWKIVSIQTAFPDARIEYVETGEILKVEFEYAASNFILLSELTVKQIVAEYGVRERTAYNWRNQKVTNG